MAVGVGGQGDAVGQVRGLSNIGPGQTTIRTGLPLNCDGRGTRGVGSQRHKCSIRGNHVMGLSCDGGRLTQHQGPVDHAAIDLRLPRVKMKPVQVKNRAGRYIHRFRIDRIGNLIPRAVLRLVYQFHVRRVGQADPAINEVVRVSRRRVTQVRTHCFQTQNIRSIPRAIEKNGSSR